MVVRLCYLFGWEPSVPLWSLTFEEIKLWLRYGEEEQWKAARVMALAQGAVSSGHADALPKVPAIVRAADGYQPADRAALKRFMGGESRKGR